MYKLAARVVWSMSAIKSTLAHARKIYSNSYYSWSPFKAQKLAASLTHCDDCPSRDVVSLFIELMNPAGFRGVYGYHGLSLSGDNQGRGISLACDLLHLGVEGRERA